MGDGRIGKIEITLGLRSSGIPVAKEQIGFSVSGFPVVVQGKSGVAHFFAGNTCIAVDMGSVDTQPVFLIAPETVGNIDIVGPGAAAGEASRVFDTVIMGPFGDHIDRAACRFLGGNAVDADAGTGSDVHRFKEIHRDVGLRKHTGNTVDTELISIGSLAADRKIVINGAACRTDRRHADQYRS